MQTTTHLGRVPLGFDPVRAADFAGLNPLWRVVAIDRLGQSPWRSICSISIVEEGRTRPAGTGWLAGPTTVITAAHVIARAERGNGDLGYEVRFPDANTGQVMQALDARYHERYRGDVALPFDPFDVGALRIAPTGRPALPLALTVPADGMVEVAGYPGMEEGRLVTHSAPSHRLDRVLLHKVDTQHGHSGAPVLVGSSGNAAVCALHVHGFEANPDKVHFPLFNLALPIEAAIADFVRANVELA